MKRLYVGCRVRILWSEGWPELAGREGRIVLRAAESSWGHSWARGWVVLPDGWESPRAFSRMDGRVMEFAPEEDQLEPIQDPGHQIVSWEAMKGLWTPEGVVA